MSFSATDIYTTSGSASLYNNWTSEVTKFDTSSFYNWEQDNLPVYDLEERTHLLWEKAGFPTSALPGMALAVSGDATPADLLSNTNLFVDVSSCIAALPEVLRYPVVIEVANYGDLGKMELHNIKMAEAGSLEIINRGFAKKYSSVTQDTGTIRYNRTTESHSEITQVSSLDLSSSWSDSSALSLGASVLSSTSPMDTRFGVDMYSFSKYPPSYRIGTITASLKNSSYLSPTFLLTESFSTTPYETLGTDLTVTSLDISATDPYTLLPYDTTRGQELGGLIDSTSWQGIHYLNYLSTISVKNCDGPIYIRGFNVDGEHTDAGLGSDVGVLIQNSDVFLEDTSVSRCNKHGIKADNSNVVLSRANNVYRIYERDSSTTRVAGVGEGITANNSTITLQGGNNVQAIGDDDGLVVTRCTTGIKLNNSTLIQDLVRTTFADETTGGSLVVERNTLAGIVAHSSTLNTKGLLDVYHNEEGIELHNSDLTYDQLCVEGNLGVGLKAVGSTVSWDGAKSFTLTGQTTRNQVDFKKNGQELFIDRVSSFGFKRSDSMNDTFGHMSFLSSHGQIELDSHIAATPSISVQGNSEAEFLHANLYPRGLDDVHTIADSTTYGLAARASNNSEIDFYGTGSGCTLVAGVPSYTRQNKVAGLHATNGSKIGLHGPTVIAQFGVDVLAENNSIVEICPAYKKGSGIYDSSGFDLNDTKNHTSVELHSTRSCVVVDKNSTFVAKDLGDYANFWGEDAIADSGYRSDDMGTSAFTSHGSLQFFPNPQDEVLCTSSSGSFTPSEDALGDTVVTKAKFTALGKQNQYLDSTSEYVESTDYGNISAMSLGGMCVRALGDSLVEVDNVHFPIGTADNALNKAWFDASGDTCHRLMIWNIADQSKLRASNLSVSGSYPGDAGYYGPSAIYLDSNGNTASGAPASTPNTGKLSILDSYGAGSSVFVLEPGTSYNTPFNNYYPHSVSDEAIYPDISEGGLVVSSAATYLYGASGVGIQANRGIFRLYFSVSPEAKYLTAINQNEEVGIPHQLFAQGYNFSGTLSSLVLDGASDSLAVSALSQKLLKLNDSDGDGISDTLGTSGFYYCSEFVEENPTQCMLDESASDSFANAKNCALGGSGRPKKVTIYRSRLDTNRASDAYPGDNIIGIKSSNVFNLERDN